MIKRLLFFTLLLASVMSAGAQTSDLQNSLKRHIDYLSSDALNGRKAGSEGERLAAEYLFEQLSNAGVEMLSGKEGDTFSIVSGDDTVHSMNIIGIVEGFDATLRNEYIVVGANFDHLGFNNLSVNGEESVQIYRGADANASGVACLIELAKMISSRSLSLRRSVLFVGFGASEKGLAGSRYFTEGGFSDIGEVKAMVNLSMLGRGNASNPFRVYSTVSKNDVKSLMDYVLDNESVTVRPQLAGGGMPSSDYVPFYQKEIPSFLFTTGIASEYRTTRDIPSLILFDNMESECVYLEAFVNSLSTKDFLLPSKQVASVGEDIYSMADCDRKPQFFHADEQHFLDSWVYKYLKYPDAAVKDGIQGRVIVSFIIEKDGTVTNVKVEKSVDELLDDEAVKVISISPKWIPGEISKNKVRTKLVLPVEFHLKSN